MKTASILALTLALAVAAAPGRARAQIAGGPFAIERSVVAGGGASRLAGGDFALGATAAQPAAAVVAGGPFTVRGGFWAAPPVVPTAAAVELSGRVATANGAGIRNAVVTLTDARGATRTAVTGTFGRYRFAELAAGEVYVLTVAARRFAFASPTIVVAAADGLDALDFIALEP